MLLNPPQQKNDHWFQVTDNEVELHPDAPVILNADQFGDVHDPPSAFTFEPGSVKKPVKNKVKKIKLKGLR